MTPQQIATERLYRFEERLALLGVYGIPTPEQRALAQSEANAWHPPEEQPDLFSPTPKKSA